MITIVSSDNRRCVYIGTADILNSLYSTICMRLGGLRKKVPLAMSFLENGTCAAREAEQTARQFNLIRDELARIPPEKAVYDMRDPKKKGPWVGNLSPVITSCANFYTTADGKDLLYEIVSILSYISVTGGNVRIQ